MYAAVNTLAPTDSYQLALFGAERTPASLRQPSDPEAAEMANAAMLAAALGLGIYIDSFV
ncbi:MAG: hypothetical protein JO104_12690 [Candidatus Eremiobacteraeota bacterium]|nr:hypothetical protein [Candidatus Eremiobacteraeota bacterium]MBV8720553.1 hypothetical protein [Candidatus Eremiobacteraeota bacterium]